MRAIEITVATYPISVLYTCDIQKDPYGTGDSPYLYDIDVCHVYLGDSDIDVIDLFDAYLDEIVEKIIEIEKDMS